MAGDDSEEKPFDPSAKRLRRLRQDGQVPRSQDFGGTLSLLAVLGYVVATRDQIIGRLQIAVRDNPVFAPIDFWERVLLSATMMGKLAMQITLPLLAIVIATALLSTILDVGGFIFSLKPLTPNFGKFNPAQGLKQMFQVRSLIDLVKSLFKIAIFSACLYVIVAYRLNDAFWAPTCGMPCILEVGLRMLTEIIVVGVTMMIVFSAIDLLISRWLFKRDNRMSLTELKREQKEDYGDPHIRAARNAERRKAAQGAGLTGMNAMNIVFAGKGTAVGVAYKPQMSGVPIVAVKRAENGAELLKVARQKGVAIVENADLVAQLLKGRIGEPIPRETFQSVAQALVGAGITGQ